MTMSLATCSKVFHSCLSLFRPVANPPRLNGRRLFSSLQKRSIFVADRLLSRHQSKGIPTRESRYPISDGGLVILGFGLLGSTLLFVSMRYCYVLCVFCLSLLLRTFATINDRFKPRRETHNPRVSIGWSLLRLTANIVCF